MIIQWSNLTLLIVLLVDYIISNDEKCIVQIGHKQNYIVESIIFC